MSKFTVVVLSMLVGLTGLAFGQTKEEIVDYMLENGVSFIIAASDLGYDPQEAAEVLGYDFSFRADREMALIFVECLGTLVFTAGSAEEIGLSKESLDQFIELRKANDLSFLPPCEGDDRLTLLSTSVWTVGDDYPIAYHIDFEIRLITYGLLQGVRIWRILC